MDNSLVAAAEAILFVSGDPIELEDLRAALNITPIEMQRIEDALKERYANAGSGITLMRFENKLQLGTKPAYRDLIEKALTPVRKQSLTQATLETLCVVAYRQPVTRMEIEAVRGVKCDYAVATLVGHGLIEEVGRKDTIGRPILYGTTEEFLRHFGISSLEELPLIEDFDALIEQME